MSEARDDLTALIVVLGKGSSELRAFKLEPLLSPGVSVVLVENDKARFGGLGKVANSYWNNATTDVFGIVHADTEFEEGAIRNFVACAYEYGVCGIVGQSGAGQVWSSQRVDGSAGEVSTLDCCSMFCRRDIGIRFDDGTFDGFHLCVEDLCLQARKAGLQVMVPLAKAMHRGELFYQDWWRAERERYRVKLAAKWHGVPFLTT